MNTIEKNNSIEISTVINTISEANIVLDKYFRVVTANNSFYKTFSITPADIEGKVFFELGNRDWDDPSLKKLLEEILPKKTFFRGLELKHVFPKVGSKTMILSARQFRFKNTDDSDTFPELIILSIEDITEIMVIAQTLAEQTNEIQAKLSSQTRRLENQIEKLEKEVSKLKIKPL